MNLRTRALLYLGVLHMLLLALFFYVYHSKMSWLIGIELLLLASFLLGARQLTQVLQPMQYVQHLQELLQEQNYVTRLRPESNFELNTLVQSFNRLLAQLYQERLRIGEQRGLLESLLQATPTAVVVFDFEARITMLNHSAEQLFGLPTPIGQRLAHWLAINSQAAATSGDFWREIDALALDTVAVVCDQHGRHFRCQRQQFIDRGFAREFLLIDEITHELKRSEQATYEKLVRVLAHEVNNTVAVTRSVLESLQYYTPQLAESDQGDFDTAIEAAKRRSGALGEFIERFTTVVKMPEPVMTWTNLNALIDDIVALYRGSCEACGIALVWQPMPDLPMLKMDRNLISQALMNIVKNAIEAVQASTANHAGYVRIEIGHNVDSEQQLGAHYQLAINDSANGLSNVPAGQLFSAFYSSKKGGQGIGLMFVREVLLRHHFAFRLASVGSETQFVIWLG
jgi:two-component system, NtrC family, nitrogen regulation sensor histidine kinase NtrY